MQSTNVIFQTTGKKEKENEFLITKFFFFVSTTKLLTKWAFDCTVQAHF